ncbi:hypothetical protein [Verminephrobacter eiseniae]|uniref:hypothetical protein n=1 Tax=Verminephrobacter eiseniae TaxID=364317 RepID=UPI002238CE8C|nr:hypothetical protein [Verminephrobacter eiseniae]MCW5235477.1 hypothetical protein [Verminephrobacter eiseniae]
MLSSKMEKLKDSLACITYNGAQHAHILIEETKATATLKKVTLVAQNGDWFSFNPERGRSMSPLLVMDAHHDHHRACDCVVVVNRNGALVVVYIELKSSKRSDYTGKFKSTRQFMRYALGLLEEFHKAVLTIAEERYFVLYGGKTILLNKTPTVPKVEKMSKSKPDAAYKREVANPARLYLKELLG